MNKEHTPNPKCSNCKCYWKPDETDIKSSGLFFKTCKRCREYNKKYYEENKEDLSSKHKIYYDENRQKINEHRKQKFDCDCGGCYNVRHKTQHSNTKQHQDWLKTQI